MDKVPSVTVELVKRTTEVNIPCRTDIVPSCTRATLVNDPLEIDAVPSVASVESTSDKFVSSPL